MACLDQSLDRSVENMNVKDNSYQNNFFDVQPRNGRSHDFVDKRKTSKVKSSLLSRRYQHIKTKQPSEIQLPIVPNRAHQLMDTSLSVGLRRPSSLKNRIKIKKREKNDRRPIQPPSDVNQLPEQPKSIDITKPQCIEQQKVPSMRRNSPTHISHGATQMIEDIIRGKTSNDKQLVAKKFQSNYGNPVAKSLGTNLKDGTTIGIIYGNKRQKKENKQRKYKNYLLEFRRQVDRFQRKAKRSNVFHHSAIFHSCVYENSMCTTKCGFAIIPGTKNIRDGFIMFQKMKRCRHFFRLSQPRLPQTVLRSSCLTSPQLSCLSTPGGSLPSSPCLTPSQPSPCLTPPLKSPPGTPNRNQIPLPETSKDLRDPECTCSCPACSYEDLCIYQKKKKIIKEFNPDINNALFTQQSSSESWSMNSLDLNWETLPAANQSRFSRNQQWRLTDTTCKYGAYCTNREYCRFRHPESMDNNLSSLQPLTHQSDLHSLPSSRLVFHTDLYNLPSRVPHTYPEYQNFSTKKSNLRADARAWHPDEHKSLLRRSMVGCD